MSDSSNKNKSTLSESKSQKVDQSVFTNLVLTDLINNVVERAKTSSSNNNPGSELQDNPDPELQEHERTSHVQKFEPKLQEKTDSEFKSDAKA
ncbi:5496_t:CDS:2 [Gigaspora rosea]|nr:5496_t:CDS:2 [Gigaspora rosea]